MQDNAYNTDKIPRRVLGGLLASLSAGVVPRTGAPYIAIGRVDETSALLDDLAKTADGGAAMRFLIGRYGSGKSFLIQLARGNALERGFVCADADLSPERRLAGGGGSGLATYRELLRNMSCRACPDGGALPVILSRWLNELRASLVAEGLESGGREFSTRLSAKIHAVALELEGEVGGFDFASVIAAYYTASENDDDAKKSACLRWLRGEYGTKTEARDALGFRIGSIVGDENWYDYIKLLAAFFRRIGYHGFVVFIDECVNLYKIANRVSRESNYEKILSMFNDTLQGKAEGLMLVLGGTPQFLEDQRRGLWSYEALRSRLTDGRFGAALERDGYRNMLSPVIRLRRLSDAELLALIVRLTRLHGIYYNWDARSRVSDADMESFLRLCLSKTGATEMITPREIIRDYMTVLNVLSQNPSLTFSAAASAGATGGSAGDAAGRSDETDSKSGNASFRNEVGRDETGSQFDGGIFKNEGGGGGSSSGGTFGSASEAARPRADAAGGSGRDNGGDAGDEDGGAADGETHYKNRSPSEYTLDDIEF